MVEIETAGGTLGVWVDGAVVFTVVDQGFQGGSIGLYCWGNVGSYFDDIVVEEMESGLVYYENDFGGTIDDRPAPPEGLRIRILD